MIHKFTNGRVILGNTIADGVSVYTKDDRIIAVTSDEREYDVLHDAGGKYISPGFIDIHVHGGFGYRFEANPDAALIVAENHAKFGTTTLLATASAETTENYVRMFENFRKLGKKNTKGAYIAGIHMEAPYFSKLQAGAQGPLIRDFDKAN